MKGSNDKMIGLAVECVYDELGVPLCGREECCQYDVLEETCKIDDARGRILDEDSVCRPKVAAQAVQLKSFRATVASLGGQIKTLRTDNDSLTRQNRDLSALHNRELSSSPE